MEINQTINQTITQQMYTDAKYTLQSLSDTLKEGATAGWDLMVNKAFYIDGVICFIFGLIMLIVAIIIGIKSIKYLKEDSLTEDRFMIGITLGVFSLFLLCIGFMDAYTGACHMILPEYYAIKDIIGLVK